MKTNIIWTGKLYHSIENCILTETAIRNEVTSTIIGNYENKIYKVEYHIKANKKWETTFVTLRIQFGSLNKLVTLEKKDGKFLWNNKANDELEGIFDVDISLTPFTNTLPINRLLLKNQERQVIDVSYFDILGKKIKPVKQIYTKPATDHYVYENYNKSFKADIKIDEQGLVVEYPKLFEMTTKHESNYR